MMTEITFVTGNAKKAEYLSRFCGFPFAYEALNLPEIQSLSGEEVAEDKARRAYALLARPVLVEDVSLTFHAFGKLPGPLIKWFLESLGNGGMCRLLDGYSDRSASARVTYVLCDESGAHTFSGETEGAIAPSPRGESNFGWDPIFIPRGSAKTFAEMTPEEKHDSSMRAPALLLLMRFLRERGDIF